jgi:deazaflavin-dependent oxidoreductase (nitroreductase family)
MRSDEKFEASFRKPNPIDRAVNRAFGFLVGLGFGLSHNYLLQVRGRKTGRLYSTPINLLEFKDKRFLVAPRGRTQWVRNVEAANEVILKRGRIRATFRLRPIPDVEKAEILMSYLDRFKLTVQRYFPVPAGSGSEAFVELAAHYPVFELLPSNTRASQRSCG